MNQTMFDFQDTYEWIADRLPDRSVIAEVGVADGTSAVCLAELLLNRGKRFTFYWIDNLAYGGPDQLQTLCRAMAKAKLPGLIEILPVDSLNASCRFPDYHFDFVFIDASHKYEPTKADIRLWYQKIKEDGLLAGHDYVSCPEVKQAVDEVIPTHVTRTDIPERDFKPERVLQVRSTAKGYGVWMVKRKFYVKLNYL